MEGLILLAGVSASEFVCQGGAGGGLVRWLSLAEEFFGLLDRHESDLLKKLTQNLFVGQTSRLRLPDTLIYRSLEFLEFHG